MGEALGGGDNVTGSQGFHGRIDCNIYGCPPGFRREVPPNTSRLSIVFASLRIPSAVKGVGPGRELGHHLAGVL